MGKITSIKIKVPKETILPDGIYSGKWGGYVIDITYDGRQYELTTKEGVRGFGINVVVTVENNIATFETIKN